MGKRMICSNRSQDGYRGTGKVYWATLRTLQFRPAEVKEGGANQNEEPKSPDSPPPEMTMPPLTFMPLKAGAPLVVGDQPVAISVAGNEERLDAVLIFVQVKATELRLIQ